MPGEAPPDIYLRFSNDKGTGVWNDALVGESVDKQNPGMFGDSHCAEGSGWFIVSSFQFTIASDGGGGGGGGGGASASAGKAPAGKAPPAGGGGAAQGKDLFKGVTVTLPLQYGCLYLMEACAKYAQKQKQNKDVEKIDKATLHVRRAGLSDYAAPGSGQDWFLEIVMHKVTIENYSMNSSCIQESIILNYEKIDITYYPTDPELKQLASSSKWVSWNNSAKGDTEQEDDDGK